MLSPTEVLLAIPATHRHLNLVGAVVSELLLREEGLAEPQLVSYNVQLALQEICANIVDHAYDGGGGRIELAIGFAHAPWRLVIELSDSGRPFEAASAVAPNLDEPQEGGYGLFLARELMDELSYDAEGGRNRWRLVQRLEGVRDAA